MSFCWWVLVDKYRSIVQSKKIFLNMWKLYNLTLNLVLIWRSLKKYIVFYNNCLTYLIWIALNFLQGEDHNIICYLTYMVTSCQIIFSNHKLIIIIANLLVFTAVKPMDVLIQLIIIVILLLMLIIYINKVKIAVVTLLKFCLARIWFVIIMINFRKWFLNLKKVKIAVVTPQKFCIARVWFMIIMIKFLKSFLNLKNLKIAVVTLLKFSTYFYKVKIFKFKIRNLCYNNKVTTMLLF